MIFFFVTHEKQKLKTIGVVSCSKDMANFEAISQSHFITNKPLFSEEWPHIQSIEMTQKMLSILLSLSRK